MTKISNLLSNLGCCSLSQEWAEGYRTYKSAWGACDRSDWILYILKELNYDPIQLRLIGAWCARNTPLGDGRTTWDLLTDERSRHAIEVAENPESTEEELKTANSAAYSATRYAANSAAYSPAYSPAYFAARSAAYTAAHFAANSAYFSANSAAYSAAGSAAYSAAYSARAAALKAQADYIKSVIKLSDVIKLINKRI
jgi:hypothetical protein